MYNICAYRSRGGHNFRVCLAIVVATKYPEYVEVFATEKARAVKPWLGKASLTLANEKTEVIFITVERKTPWKWKSVDIWQSHDF